MNLLLMAEGEPVEAIIIKDSDGADMAKYIEEYNKFQDTWWDNNPDISDECSSLIEWLDREKNITTAPLKLEAISMVDGYWYT